MAPWEAMFANCYSAIFQIITPTDLSTPSKPAYDAAKYNLPFHSFPFITPKEMEHWLTKMELADQYTFTAPVIKPLRPVVTVHSSAAVAHVLNDASTFGTMYSDALKALTKENDFFVAFNDPLRHRHTQTMVGSSYTVASPY